MPEREKLCKSCKWAKDKWHDSCYCAYYGFIFAKGKTDCWGYERKEDENATVDDHREPDERT